MAASTLIIKDVPYIQDNTKYTIVFDAKDAPMQYMLETTIPRAVVHDMTYLDGMAWSRAPHPRTEFDFRGHFSVRCSMTLEGESKNFLDELRLYRNFQSQAKGGILQNESLGFINKDKKNYVDRSDKFMYRGSRKKKKSKGARVKYDVSVAVTNGTSEDEGMYACFMEREHDRAYIATLVTQSMSAVYDRPTLEVVSCGGGRKFKAAKAGRRK